MNRSVWFPGDLAARVEVFARSQDRSFNWVVVRALESALGSAGDADSSGTPGTPAPDSASSRAPVHNVRPVDLPGVTTARRLALERQAKLNKEKS